MLDYLAGFFDAEGCVYLNLRNAVNGRVNVGYDLKCAVSNADPEPVKIFKDVFGGRIDEVHLKNPKYKTSYMWQTQAQNAASFLETLYERLIVKKAQANVAIIHQSRKKLSPKLKSKEQVELERSEYLLLRKLKKDIDITDIVRKNVSFAYLAGFFDGEGCVQICSQKHNNTNNIRTNYFLSCTAGNCDIRPVLCLKNTFGGSIKTKKFNNNKWRTFYTWSISTKQALNFLLQIKEYLITKKDEANIGIQHQNRKRNGWNQYNSKDETTILAEKRDVEIIKKLKHREFNLK